MTSIDKAERIAEETLERCFRDGGLIASADHFVDFWARDSFYASWGLIERGAFDKVRSNLELFIRHQKADGQIPRRIDRFVTALNYLGIRMRRKKLRPKYGGAYVVPALDPNLLFIIVFSVYAERSGDDAFLECHFASVIRAMEWLERHERNGLLQEGIFANWMDVIVKTGAVLYTNVLYSEAAGSLARLAELSGDKELAKGYRLKQKTIIGRINSDFWNGRHYVDWIRKGKKHGYFSTDGNVLALLFGLADQEKAESIIGVIEESGLDAIPLKTNHPKYPWWRVALRMYLIGVPGYQNEHASWLWLGCVYAAALHRIGQETRSRRIRERIANRIGELGAVWEIYDPAGRPYRGWYWKSAADFAWSSGTYLWMEARCRHQERA